MSRLVAIAVALIFALAAAPAGADPSATAASASEILAGAEAKFSPPASDWFGSSQARVREEARRVSDALEAHDAEAASAWKRHLRWDLLERNLGAPETIDVAELEVVRRWLYSNREGLEWPFFAELRAAFGDYLDAAYTTTHADLENDFVRHVERARVESLALAYEPTDANAAALGRTLGWFERTRQLSDERLALEKLLSGPNLRTMIHEDLIERVMTSMSTSITETVTLVERTTTPSTNPLQRSREMVVRGKATMEGNVRIDVVPNPDVAQVDLIYEGAIGSTARGETGPVALRMRVSGSAQIVRPAYVTGRGIDLGETAVKPQVQTRIVAIDAPNELVRTIAERRSRHPVSQAQMNKQARATATEQLTLKFNERVEEGINKIRADIEATRSSAGAFRDATAPLAREGAVPTFLGSDSTEDHLRFNVVARQRGQLGAALELPADMAGGDVVLAVHISFFNNLAETILGGKTLSDSFVMKYAKVVHAELPLPLMVHSRAPTWSLTMAKRRPLELVVAEPGQLVLVSRVTALEVDGVATEMNATARMTYELRRDEFGDYSLVRRGDVELEAGGSPEARTFLAAKLEAFFGPTLTGGGVIVPAGGRLASMKQLHWHGVRAERDWIVTAWDVPAAAIQEMIRLQEQQRQTANGDALAAPSTSGEVPAEASAPAPRRG